jgi:hypothetical protein
MDLSVERNLGEELAALRAAKIDANDLLKNRPPLELPSATNEVNWNDYDRRMCSRLQAVLTLYDLPATNEGWCRLAVTLASEKFPGLSFRGLPINNLPEESNSKLPAFRERAVRIARSNIESGKFSSKMKACHDAAEKMNRRSESPIADPNHHYNPICDYDVRNWYDARLRNTQKGKDGGLPGIEPQHDYSEDSEFLQAANVSLTAVQSMLKAAAQLGADINPDKFHVTN